MHKTTLNLALQLNRKEQPFDNDAKAIEWVKSCLNCNVNHASVEVQKIDVPAMPTVALGHINAAFDRVNTLLDASGALDSEHLQRAVYKLRLEIARAMGDDERTAAAARSISELTPSSDKLEAFLAVLGKADAVIVSDGAVCNTWSTSPAHGDGNNQVVLFAWHDEEGRAYSVILTEGGIDQGQWTDEAFICPDHEGQEVRINFCTHKSLTPILLRADDTEVFPGATRCEVASVMMQDIVGDYEVPDTVPEWQWVQREAAFIHAKNGQDGVWEFVLNLACDFENVPDALKPVIEKARENHQSYIIFHQGT